jgi:hypothetical protein
MMDSSLIPATTLTQTLTLGGLSSAMVDSSLLAFPHANPNPTLTLTLR